MKMSDEMVLVPKRPTDDMVKHGLMPAPIRVSKADVREIYAAMIEAFDPITWEAARNQVIRELIEKALGSEANNYKAYDCYAAFISASVAEWLRSQLEEENE